MLHILTCVFNPMRYRSRYQLYENFRRYVGTQDGARLYTVEIAFGDRDFAIPSADLKLRTLESLWHKERSLNLLERCLPRDWKYLAWIDADVTFSRPDWVDETIQQLQHYEIVQMWSEAVDLSPQYQMMDRHLSFAASYLRGAPQPPVVPGFDVLDPGYPKPSTLVEKQIVGTTGIHAWHPGFAWAINRGAWEELGGLFDRGILGAGDNHMAKSLIGDGCRSYNQGVSQGYKDEVLAYEVRSKRLQRDLGVVDGLLCHYWHGRKADRQYWDRWKILVDTQFDPNTDLDIDLNGLFRVRADRHTLRDRLRMYFQQRNEDTI